MGYLSKEHREMALSKLGKVSPNFERIKDKSRHATLNKLTRWVMNDKRQLHNARAGWFFMPNEERKKTLGFRTAADFHDATKGIIEVDHSFSIKRKETKAYRPTEAATQIIMGCYLNSLDETRKLEDWNGNKLNSPVNAISSRDANNTNAACKGKLNSLQRINRGKVVELVEYAQKERYRVATGQPSTIKRLQGKSANKQIEFIDRLIRSGIGTLYYSNYQGYQDMMPHYYREAISGRIIGRGFNLQNAPRELKNAAFSGCYDYDIENCHVTLSAQLGKREGLDTSALDWYIELKADKPEFRRFAETLNCDTSQLKLAFLAIIYGCSFNDRDDYALHETLFESTSEFISNLEVKDFYSQATNIRNAVVANSNQRAHKIVNMLGKSMPNTEATKSLYAHVLHGYEAKMLHHAIDLFSDKIVLLSHDGFAANDDSIDTERLISEYKKSTGLTIKMTKEKLIWTPQAA